MANQEAGIKLKGATSIVSCTASENTLAGFVGGNENVFSLCSAVENGGDGFTLESASKISKCNSIENRGNGISVKSETTVNGCNCNDNGTDEASNAGILVSSRVSRFAELFRKPCRYKSTPV